MPFWGLTPNFHRNYCLGPKCHLEGCLACWCPHRRSVSPQHSWELIRLCPFCPLETGFDQFEQSPICDFCLAICLWMFEWRIVILYPQLLAKIPKLVAVKLSSIVRDDDSWNSKLTNEVFPHEVLYLGLRYNCQRLCFHPFCEIIDGNKYEFY